MSILVLVSAIHCDSASASTTQRLSNSATQPPDVLVRKTVQFAGGHVNAEKERRKSNGHVEMVWREGASEGLDENGNTFLKRGRGSQS